MPPKRHRLALAAAVTLVLAGLLVASAGLLAALPALFAFLPLLAGRYLGAERLERLIAARAPAIDRRAARRPSSPRASREGVLPRGARLLAFSLANRPPPAAALSH